MALDSISVVKIHVWRHRNVGRIEVTGDLRPDGAMGVSAADYVLGVGLVVGLVVAGAEVGARVLA